MNFSPPNLRGRNAGVLPSLLRWLPWEKSTIWGLFLLLVYFLRDFFFIIFMTFILSYIMRSVVMSVARLISPGRTRAWLERSLTVAGFALLLSGMYGFGLFLAPTLVAQVQALKARTSRIDPQQEFNSFLEKTIGAYLFNAEYGDRADERYREAFEKFREQGIRQVGAYQGFPSLETFVEGHFEENHEDQIRRELSSDQFDEQAFDKWFLSTKASALFDADEKGSAPGSPQAVQQEKSLERKFLEVIKAAPKDLARFRRQWIDELVRRRFREIADAPAYRTEHRDDYDELREQSPTTIPYDYDEYLKLKAAYPKGDKAFSEALEAPETEDEVTRIAQAHTDFRLKMHQELTTAWLEGPTGREFRNHVTGYLNDFVSGATGWLREGIPALFRIPVQLTLSLLLSFFITFDMPNMQKGIGRLRRSRISNVYDEIAPGLINFGQLIGRAFEAQGVIALFNSLLTLIAIKIIGIHNEVFLCSIVFVCSFIPVVGVVLSSLPISLMAIVQPDGTVLMAVEAIGAILVIHFLETSLLNPKILGDMLHLHPVLVLAVLAVGEHFFGVWGLLLGVPVAVYIIRFVILDEGIPGFIELAAMPIPEQASAAPTRKLAREYRPSRPTSRRLAKQSKPVAGHARAAGH